MHRLTRPALLIRRANYRGNFDLRFHFSTSPSNSDLPNDLSLREGPRSHVHFKLSPKKMAFSPDSKIDSANVYETDDFVAGDHTGRQQVYSWSCLGPLFILSFPL
jgi:hypothetical protein